MRLAGVNHFLTLQNLTELLKRCEEKALVDEVVASSNDLVLIVSAGYCID